MLRKKPNNQSGLGSIKLGMCYAAKDGISVTTLGNHSKLMATIILLKSLTLLGNFCKGVKIIHFSSKFIFWPL